MNVDPDDAIRHRLLAIFEVEAQEHLHVLSTNLLALERRLPPEPERRVAEAMFREAHTLKGAARSVGLDSVEATCQALEGVLRGLTRDELTLMPAVLEGLRRGVDELARLLAHREPTGTTAAVTRELERAAQDALGLVPPVPEDGQAAGNDAAPQVLFPGTASETIRVERAKLDALLLQAEELLAQKAAVGERVRQGRALLNALTDRTIGRDSRDAETRARQLVRALSDDERSFARAVEGLRDHVRALRMSPAASVLDLFPRMVDELARAEGKEVDLTLRGTELEVDRRVLEAVKDPLIHLVRNAVDHGIEAPHERAERGKPSRGRLEVSIVSRPGERVEITVEDDGAGIDRPRVREAAVRLGQLSREHAETLADGDLLAFVYLSGLSTSPIVTGVSGHGLGLAIVKQRVEDIGGEVHLESTVGRGTAIRLSLPATIATFRAIAVRDGGQQFLIPVDAVEQVVHLAATQRDAIEGREVIRWNDRTVPIARLAAILSRALSDGGAPSPARVPCVLIRAGDDVAGLLVDEIAGDQEVLEKEVEAPLGRLRNVSGAALLPSGRLVLTLRPADLVRGVGQFGRRPARREPVERQARQPTVLVVDDSITTRTMEKSILEGAGYRVRVAVDGAEAWSILESEDCDLVVSDVDMPRLNGFDLTARIRADARFAALPVVLVTALGSRDDRERGVEVGANAYLVKSSFDQSNFLGVVRRLA